MAALAYVLLPISGMMAFFSQGSFRVRFHGAQAVAFGLVWPLVLYGSSALSATVTQITFVLGAVIWLALIATAATGRDLRLPLLGSFCARAAGGGDVR
jgi:uncharacterized membrane protein